MASLQDAFCGSVGALFCTYVGMPFDTTKVRLQTSGRDVFSGPLSAAVATVREEGASALWKGSVPALASALIENAVVFAANGALTRIARQVLRLDVQQGDGDVSAPVVKLTFAQEAILGGMSGFCSATAICPAEVLKCRLQVDRARTSSSGPSSSPGSAGARNISNNRIWRCAAELVRQDGPSGFFRGITALWARDVPYYVIFFAAYSQYTKVALAFTGAESKSELSPLHYVLGGGIAGMAGWGAVFPLDVIKSRKQIGVLANDMPLWRAARTIVRNEGLAGAMRGWGPAVMRGFPANGALLLGVETARAFVESLS